MTTQPATTVEPLTDRQRQTLYFDEIQDIRAKFAGIR